VVEDADPFELTEEEDTEEATESTMHCEATISEDKKKIPVEKQPTFLVGCFKQPTCNQLFLLKP